MEKKAISIQRRTLGIPTLISTYETFGPVARTGLLPEDKKEINVWKLN
jgi:hypothetical protein